MHKAPAPPEVQGSLGLTRRLRLRPKDDVQRVVRRRFLRRFRRRSRKRGRPLELTSLLLLLVAIPSRALPLRPLPRRRPRPFLLAPLHGSLLLLDRRRRRLRRRPRQSAAVLKKTMTRDLNVGVNKARSMPSRLTPSFPARMRTNSCSSRGATSTPLFDACSSLRRTALSGVRSDTT